MRACLAATYSTTASRSNPRRLDVRSLIGCCHDVGHKGNQSGGGLVTPTRGRLRVRLPRERRNDGAQAVIGESNMQGIGRSATRPTSAQRSRNRRQQQKIIS